MRFEVLKEDGTARLGSLRLTNKKEIRTPAIISKDLLDDPSVKIYDSVSHPHINYLKKYSELLITRLNQSDYLNQSNYQYDKPCYHISNDKELQDKPAEVYILPYVNRYLGNYRNISTMLTKTRDSISPDSALCIRAVASPENVSILVYHGVDLFDDVYGKIAALRGVYLTTDGEFKLKNMDNPKVIGQRKQMSFGHLEEFPCNCPTCEDKTPTDMDGKSIRERIDFLYQHNCYALDAEIKKIRYLIESENITEYVDKQCRSSPWTTALYRVIDRDFLSRRVPLFRKSYLYSNTSDSLNRIEIKNFNDRMMNRYQKPDLDNLLILPCSAKKPYSLSPSHITIVNAILPYRKYLHEVILTSPLGIVPRELELIYPASAYDIPVTGDWTHEEIEWAKDCLRRYLDNNKYKNIIAHVEGPYKEICESVEEEVGLSFNYTCEDGVTGDKSLENLRDVMIDINTHKKIMNNEKKFFVIRSMLSYQFGRTMAEDILSLPDSDQDKGKDLNLKVRGKYPNMTVFLGKKQYLKVNMAYRSVDLTIDAVENVKKIKENIFPGDYTVSIEDFVPLGDVFNVGVIDADEQIRPNDLVLFEGKKAIGIGRARISGWEMVKSKKGSAINVKAVKEIV